MMLGVNGGRIGAPQTVGVTSTTGVFTTVEQMNLSRSFLWTPQIPTNGLVLWLDAANRLSYSGSGTNWYDLSGNSYNGVLTNGPTYNSANSGSIVFDGVNDYVQINGTPTIVISTGTFITWIKRNGSQVNYAGFFYCRGTSVTGLTFFGTSNKISYTWNNAANTYSWDSGLVVPDLAWCMCALSVSASSATAYLCQTSGISSATNTVSHTSTTLNDLRLGQDPESGARNYNGNIAQALLYNRALSSTEVQQVFNSYRTRFGV